MPIEICLLWAFPYGSGYTLQYLFVASQVFPLLSLTRFCKSFFIQSKMLINKNLYFFKGFLKDVCKA
jgi:hypothetical protein